MKTFEDFFPELKTAKNHTVIIMEETFNKYYNKLDPEDQGDFINDFRTLIKESKIENSGKINIPLQIIPEKTYLISDFFHEDYAKQVDSILKDIDTGGNALSDEDSDFIFENDDTETEIIDDTDISKDEQSDYNTPKAEVPEYEHQNKASDNKLHEEAQNNVDIEQEDNDEIFSLFNPSSQYVDDIELPEEKQESLNDDKKNEENDGRKVINEGAGVVIMNKQTEAKFDSDTIMELLEEDFVY